jgi:hypothetical protein
MKTKRPFFVAVLLAPLAVLHAADTKPGQSDRRAVAVTPESRRQDVVNMREK